MSLNYEQFDIWHHHFIIREKKISYLFQTNLGHPVCERCWRICLNDLLDSLWSIPASECKAFISRFVHCHGYNIVSWRTHGFAIFMMFCPPWNGSSDSLFNNCFFMPELVFANIQFLFRQSLVPQASVSYFPFANLTLKLTILCLNCRTAHCLLSKASCEILGVKVRL